MYFSLRFSSSSSLSHTAYSAGVCCWVFNFKISVFLHASCCLKEWTSGYGGAVSYVVKNFTHLTKKIENAWIEFSHVSLIAYQYLIF